MSQPDQIVELRQKLLGASSQKRFLAAVYENSLGPEEERRQQLVNLLVELHNSGLLDIVKEFSNLRRAGDGPDFFLTRHIFELALPNINAPVRDVMDVVNHLSTEAHGDMMANAIFEPFVNFIARDPQRATSAFNLIRDEGQRWNSVLCPVIVAGARQDVEVWTQSAMKLIKHESVEIKAGAIFTLGRIDYPAQSQLPLEAFQKIEGVVGEESEDQVLAAAIKATASLAIRVPALIEKLSHLFEAALSKGGEFTKYEATWEFGLQTAKLPESTLQVVADHLPQINATHGGIIKNVDYGIAALIRLGKVELAITCFERILTLESGPVAIKDLASATHGFLSSDKKNISKLVTKWFLTGNPVLCNSITEILSSNHLNDPQLEVDHSELPEAGGIELIFLARKSIGYLFLKPQIVASFILSLLKETEDDQIVGELRELLWDSVLVNYPGRTREYLEARKQHEQKNVVDSIDWALTQLSDYLKQIEDIGDIAEIQPSIEEREIHIRKFQKQMSTSYKEAMKSSIIRLIANRSVLLYGRSSITYTQHGMGNQTRTEIPLQPHRVEMEFPRRHNLDPIGVDYLLRVYRVEKLVNK